MLNKFGKIKVITFTFTTVFALGMITWLFIQYNNVQDNLNVYEHIEKELEEKLPSLQKDLSVYEYYFKNRAKINYYIDDYGEIKSSKSEEPELVKKLRKVYANKKGLDNDLKIKQAQYKLAFLINESQKKLELAKQEIKTEKEILNILYKIFFISLVLVVLWSLIVMKFPNTLIPEK